MGNLNNKKRTNNSRSTTLILNNSNKHWKINGRGAKASQNSRSEKHPGFCLSAFGSGEAMVQISLHSSRIQACPMPGASPLLPTKSGTLGTAGVKLMPCLPWPPREVHWVCLQKQVGDDIAQVKSD